MGQDREILVKIGEGWSRLKKLVSPLSPNKISLSPGPNSLIQTFTLEERGSNFRIMQ